MTDAQHADDEALVEILRDPRFRGGWARYRHALSVNAGGWPTSVVAARMVAVATDVWSGSPGVWSYNSWEKALRSEFPDFFERRFQEGRTDGR